jgi:hypothetical protein
MNQSSVPQDAQMSQQRAKAKFTGRELPVHRTIFLEAGQKEPEPRLARGT